MPLLSAFQRLIDLLAEPQDIPILAPIIQREITYRLLVGDQGAHLRQMATVGSRSHRIAQAIDWLKSNFARPFRVDDLASRVSMSKTTFHRHFRTVTAMSPLQYQKRWRLNEAKRLMLTERLDAATAALQVGYESASQFSREYTRMFGAPPLRDIMKTRRSPMVECRDDRSFSLIGALSSLPLSFISPIIVCHIWVIFVPLQGVNVGKSGQTQANWAQAGSWPKPMISLAIWGETWRA